jgi:hypothetical protein
MDNIDTKLQTIQNYYNYLGSILSKGYNNDITELNNIIKSINDDMRPITKQTYYNYKKTENSLFSLDSSDEEKSELSNENNTDEEDKDEDNYTKSEKSESENESEDDNQSRVSLYDKYFGKNTSNENTDKVEIFRNKSIEIEKILLYKSTTKYIKKLKRYMKLIKNY